EHGSAGPQLQRDAGKQIARLGANKLIGVRGLAENIVAGAREAGMNGESAVFTKTPEEAAEMLIKEVRRGDLILVKGSRGVKTEIVVAKLKERFEIASNATEATAGGRGELEMLQQRA